MWPTHKSWMLFLQLFLLLDFKAMGKLQNNFLVIRDTSFVCKDGKLQFRKAELTDDDKLELLESRGGHLLTSYMARDQRSAEETFINLLPLQSFEIEEEMPKPKQIESQRDDSYTFTKRVDRKTFRQKAAVLQYLNEIVEKENRMLADNLFEVLSGSRSSEVPKKSTRRRISRRGRGKRHVTSSSHRTTDAPSQQQTANSTVQRNIPFVLPHELGLKTTYFSEISGVRTLTEYCQQRGSSSADGKYLHLCTTCAATVNLPANHFPQIMNEAICKLNDSSCLIVGPVAEGDCIQKTVPMQILKKKEGYCSLALKNDEMFIVDEWEITSYERKVGCECMMHKDSIFAPYV